MQSHVTEIQMENKLQTYQYSTVIMPTGVGGEVGGGGGNFTVSKKIANHWQSTISTTFKIHFHSRIRNGAFINHF